MKYFNLLTITFSYYPNIQFYFNIFLLLIIIIIFYWCISVTLVEMQFNFSLLFSKSAYKRFEMKNEDEHINISLLYKLYSVPLTIIECILYFILVILSVFILRLIRLGTVMDAYEISYKINNILIITKLIYLIIIIFYLFMLKQYIEVFSSRLYYKLKQLYIYSLQLGGLYDIVNYREGDNKDSYVTRYIEQPMEKLYLFIRFIGKFYEPITLYNPNLFVFPKKNNGLDDEQYHIAQTLAKHIEKHGGITYNCADTKISFLLEQFLPIYLKAQEVRMLSVFSRMHPNDKKLCSQVIKKYAPEFFEQHQLLLEIT